MQGRIHAIGPGLHIFNAVAFYRFKNKPDAIVLQSHLILMIVLAQGKQLLKLVNDQQQPLAVGGLSGSGCLNPPRGHKLVALPLPFLQVELAKPSNILGADALAVTTDRDSLRTGFPTGSLDAQWLEKAGLEVVENGREGHAQVTGHLRRGQGSQVEEDAVDRVLVSLEAGSLEGARDEVANTLVDREEIEQK